MNDDIGVRPAMLQFVVNCNIAGLTPIYKVIKRLEDQLNKAAEKSR